MFKTKRNSLNENAADKRFCLFCSNAFQFACRKLTVFAQSTVRGRVTNDAGDPISRGICPGKRNHNGYNN